MWSLISLDGPKGQRPHAIHTFPLDRYGPEWNFGKQNQGFINWHFFFFFGWETWLLSMKQYRVQIFTLLSTIEDRSKNKILLVSLFLRTIIKLGLEFIWLDILFLESQCCRSGCKYFVSCQVFWWVFFFFYVQRGQCSCSSFSSMVFFFFFCKLGRASILSLVSLA